MLNHIKNNPKNSHLYKIIWHIANYILILQPFLTNKIYKYEMLQSNLSINGSKYTNKSIY